MAACVTVNVTDKENVICGDKEPLSSQMDWWSMRWFNHLQENCTTFPLWLSPPSVADPQAMLFGNQ